MVQWSDLPIEIPGEGEKTFIRQSTIGQFQLCPKRVGLSNQEGFLPAVSEAMCFGTCLHYLVAADLEAGEARLDLLTNMGEWVDKILVDEYEWSVAQITKPEEFFSSLGVAYRTWRQQVRPLIKNLVTFEEEMFLYLGDGDHSQIWLKGTPDIVTQTRLRDTKTTKKLWAPAKAQLSIQTSLYLPLVKQNCGLDYKKFTFDIYDRSKSTWTSISVERTVKEINAALDTAYEYGRMLEAQIFPATPVPDASFNKARGWYCRANWCGAWNICNSKFLDDATDETEVAVRSW